jgi:SAM-dependent methyltransferase
MVRVSERLRLRRTDESPPPVTEPSPGPTHEPGQAEPLGAGDLQREVAVGQLASDQHPVSRLLYERLGPEEIARAEAVMREAPEFSEMAADPGDQVLRRWLTLHAAMWRRPERAAELTGLRPAQPPEDVHAMARGAWAAAGALYEADLVADGLASVGAQIGELRSGLDFGCSSGRVVRVLAAAYPGVRWFGCDPNNRAIEWARANLPGIEFSVSGNEPPLSLEPASLEFAFAISIWSHFEPSLGLRWLEEMRRVMAPGGYLVMTTHGLTSVGYYAGNGLRPPEQCAEIARALYRRGWWYAPEFGPAGDWGVVNPAWGTAFLSPEWVLSQVSPQWRILEFAAGRNAGNQDVYVLQRT